MADDYSIWFVETSYESEFPNHLTFNDRYTEGMHEMPHGFLYVEGNGHKILIDTGWNGTSLDNLELYGVKNFQQPAAALKELGVTPEEIDTVVFTHAHLDHAANTYDFPNATFYIQERELFESIKMMCAPERYKNMVGAVDPRDIVDLIKRAQEHRLVLLDGKVENWLPGIDLYPAFNTHSEGHQFIHIRNDKQTGGKGYIACGDLVFKYANLIGYDKKGDYIPIVNGAPHGWTLAKVYDEMLSLVDGEYYRILPSHEKDVNQYYPYKTYAEGLDIIEIALAEGEESRIK